MRYRVGAFRKDLGKEFGALARSITERLDRSFTERFDKLDRSLASLERSVAKLVN